MKVAAVAVALLSSLTEGEVVSTGLTLSGTASCGSLNSGACRALKEDLPSLSRFPDKFTSLSERSKACARTMGNGCECTLEGTIMIQTDSICSSGPGYQIPDHILRNGWVIDPKIIVNKDLTSCATKATYSPFNKGLCTNPTLGEEVMLTPSADSITLHSGNPTAELSLPCSMATDGMVFFLNIKHGVHPEC